MPQPEILALGFIALVCACLATMITVRFGGVWFVGFALGAVLGPIGVLVARLRMGRICWHCWSRIHLNARVCHDCGNDVVDRRKGKADSSGFGKRKDIRKMRAPTDVEPASS